MFADGPEGALQCIEQEFGLDIDHYMVTNFVGMARIIDAIGGADAYVTSAVAHDCNHCIYEMNPLMGYPQKANYITSFGNVHLSGIQAVAFMRQRKQDGGFARDDKQKEILLSLKESLGSLSIQEINVITSYSIHYTKLYDLSCSWRFEKAKFGKRKKCTDKNRW